MLDDLHFAQILDKIPWVHVLITVGLFIAASIISKFSKRLLKKRISQKAEKRESFWFQFWKSESKLLLKSITLIIWLSYISITLYIWSGYIGKLFTRIEYLYAPLLRAFLIVIVAIIALKTSQHLINFLIEQVAPITKRGTIRGKQRVDTLQHVFSYGSTIIIIIVAVLMLLDNFGIDLKAILATVGIASLAVGFGAQSLVKDIVSGTFIIMEDQFGVGDVAIINGEGGFVERMTLRITQLRNTEGMLITIPNGSINMVKNLTSEWSRVDYMIGVAYETNLDHALDVLMDEAGKLKKDMPNEIIEDPERLGVDEFGDSSITLRLWIKTKPLKQWLVKRELNRRVHKRFEDEGIVIPFPQRTVWIKEPKEALLAKLIEKKA